ncbi:hypothetical protein A8F94_10840 [Bacillus sp. FJAT-27225]|uniref:S8 family serine peptidase n=1 Tax=Bacillus sp. FJAT-27225 TaxID=1743144 RepID=UPI00080C31D5|nr:S8 family serine peptidase [Bacillus sp. FJAT-27225]OCA88286.1 hypothetical protein A8F94_10840 [Bacillus sp. FJAT-27225]
MLRKLPFLAITILIYILVSVSPSEASDVELSGNGSPGVIVKYNSSAIEKGTIKRRGASLGRGMERIQIPKEKTISQFIEELELSSDVEYVEPDYKLKKEYVPNDPYYKRQWQHEAINSNVAWEKTKGNNQITVAVIDDGVQITHPDLRHSIISPYDVINMTSTNPYNNHATHVAGIIASAIDNGQGGTGVSPNVKVIPINVFSGESAYVSDVIKALNYATDRGAKIINISLGSPDYSQALADSIQAAYNKGSIIIAAAGNESTSSPSYPASFPNVLSVSSTDIDDGLSYYSNYGRNIDIAAPGSGIFSTLVNGYGFMSGTSMSAPVVSGVAALIWSTDPALNNSQVINRLLYSADDLGPLGFDTQFGYGRVNAEKALIRKKLSPPLINNVNIGGLVIGGKVTSQVEQGRILLENGEKLLSETNLNSDNSFQIKIPHGYENGKLTIRLTDKYGNSSDSYNIYEGRPAGWVLSNGYWSYYDLVTGEKKIGFQQIDGSRYYFNPEGKMATGWQFIEGSWYYFNDSGRLNTGWFSLGGDWYYLSPLDGKMKTGWLNTDGIWYYLNPDGSMKTGWLKWGDSWYYLNPDGSMKIGWLLLGSSWYYLNPDGSMKTGWLLLGSTWYYLNPDGTMETGWLWYYGNWYYLEETGNMVTGWKFFQQKWYYFYQGGNMAVNTYIGPYKIGPDGAWVN